MKLLLRAIFPLLLLTSTGGRAQMASNLDRDSVIRVLHSLPADTNKVLTYITLGQLYEENKTDSAIWCYHQAKALSEKLNYVTGILKYISNYTAVLNMQGKYDESLKLNLEAVDLSRKSGSRRQLMTAYYNVGAVYQYKEEKAKALDWYLKALPLLEAESDRQNLGIFFGNLSALYNDLGHPEKGVAFGKRALALGEEFDDPYIIAMAANNLGQGCMKLNQLEEGRKYMQITYDIGRKDRNFYYMNAGLLGLGDYYLKKGQPHRYLPLLQEALPYADSIGDVRGKVNAQIGLGVGYYFTRRFDQAEKFLRRAIAGAIEHDQKESLQSAYVNLSDVLIAKGDLEGGRELRRLHDSVENLLRNDAIVRNVQELDTRYQVQKQQNEILRKDIEIEKSNARAARQQDWLIVLLGGLVLLLILLYLLYRFFGQKRLLDRQQIEALKTEQENIRLKALVEGQAQERRRISQEMHDDLGSGLTSILFLSHTLKGPSSDPASRGVAEKITSAAGGLIGKMNEIIWMMNDQHDTLEDLLVYLRVNLAETLENAGLGFHCTIPPSLPAIHLTQKQRRNIYLIVKEAVHNVIKHAGATQVTIRVDAGTTLRITVADNGRGIDPDGGRLFSNGMRNMKERAQELSGEVKITSNAGTELQLQMPL